MKIKKIPYDNKWGYIILQSHNFGLVDKDSMMGWMDEVKKMNFPIIRLGIGIIKKEK